ncbi:DUF4352 domain-containing protein [Salicibibacter kimchii]|uniref:DUF4352 domain-containing protein n=1 Tax=Salicibibacter kimchii TaxID=2099786 RepID=A0A345C142_9BACI|nr:DUF4352 domain-containing protein [Salicibibacter kimchii]AXF56923.1 DUF4352 domain-containing protein [Salicibibacter kimchii]
MKKWMVTLGLSMTLVAVTACGASESDQEDGNGEDLSAEENEAESDGKEAEEENDENEEEENEAEEEALEEQTFAVGDTVEHDDYGLTVGSVEFSSGDEIDNPDSGNEYVIVEMTIDNDGDDTISYNPYHFSIQNSDGNITDQAFTTIDSDTSLSSGDLAPDGTVSGTVVFEAPEDDPELTLIFEPSFWSADEVRINLNE